MSDADSTPFSYGRYEECLRDEGFLRGLQGPRAELFRSRGEVLDLGCGRGLFLEILREQGIRGRGVDRDADAVAIARQRGLLVEQDSILDYLEKQPSLSLDAIFCSHVVEHLPFAEVERLFRLAAASLRRGGRLVVVTPNPESLRMHLFGFWKDPEHVRFYHAELLYALAAHYGLKLVSSNREQPESFLPVPHLDGVSGQQAFPPAPPRRWRDRVARAIFGFDRHDLASLARSIHDLAANQRNAAQQLNLSNNALVGALNQYCAWPDETVLVFDKPLRADEPGSPNGRAASRTSSP
jgi:O-antigen chain-terminating methyltransferase